MRVTVQFKQEDWFSYQAMIQKRMSKGLPLGAKPFWILVAVALVMLLIHHYFFGPDIDLHGSSIFLTSMVFLMFIAFLFISQARINKRYAPSEDGPLVGTHHYDINETGIHVRGEGFEGMHEWSMVKRLDRGNGLVVLLLDTVYGHVFPEREIEDADAFYGELHELVERYRPATNGET